MRYCAENTHTHTHTPARMMECVTLGLDTQTKKQGATHGVLGWCLPPVTISDGPGMLYRLWDIGQRVSPFLLSPCSPDTQHPLCGL